MGEDSPVFIVALLGVWSLLSPATSRATFLCCFLGCILVAGFARIEKNKIIRILFLRLFFFFCSFLKMRERNLSIFLRFIARNRTP